MSAIFKRELQAYFHSMLGFIFIAVFMAVCNLYFILNNIMYGSSMLSPVFSVMIMLLMLLMPLLTMRSFSEEFKQKTDQLLLTAPVKVSGIVLGKFLAILAVFTASLLVSLIWILLIGIYGQPYPAEILGNYIGILCLACVFISLGMLLSSLTENQLISAVSSVGVFFIMYLLGLLLSSMGVSLPGWLYAILDFISLFTRFYNISAGVLQLNDLVYYLSLSGLFLFLTGRVLDKKRWS